LQDLPFGRHEVILKTGNITIFQLFGITGNHLITKSDKYVFYIFYKAWADEQEYQ
jgi:hypothetical protein